MKKIFTRLALLALLCSGISAYGTHLMGGNLSYTFTSFNPGNNTYTYFVELRIYRYCAPGSSNLPNNMALGVYHQNPAQPNANKVLAGSFNIPLVRQAFITPPNPDPNCTFSSNVCVEEGTYTTSIVLPASTNGYILIAQSCCRNNNISNLINPGGTGMVWYATMPPTSLQDNSPSFATVPVPFICAGDTTSILNAAFDADGDSLSYAFVTPYNGTSGSGNPNPSPPNPYPWPITEVTFDAAAGYSLSHPFGTGDYIHIDPTTGLASYMSPNQGFYVIAVEISEYRNGVLIGVMRRDLQIIVIPCPVNHSPSFGGGQNTFTVPEGTNLCFTINSTDADGDSIFLSASGPIFNGAQTNPPATITVNNGAGASSAQFCWATSCEQGRTTSYQFTVAALDDGCPAKTSNNVYTINVEPTTISPIAGPDTVCATSSSVQLYSILPSGFSHQWDVTGGTLVSGGTTDTAHVQWTSTNGTVSAYAINSQGCHSDTALKNVVASNPQAMAGPDLSLCDGESAVLGSPAVAGQTYQWSPATGLSSDTVAEPTFELPNPGPSPLTMNYYLTVAQPGCMDADTVTVTVFPALTVAAVPVGALCADASPVTLAATPSGGTFSGDGVAAGQFDPAAAGPGVHEIIYAYSDTNGCAGSDTLHITVNAVPAVDAGSYAALCADAAPVQLSGMPAGGAFAGDGVTGSVFDPAAAGSGPHTLVYTYSDSNGCSAADTTTITVLALPVADAGADISACADALPVLLSGSPAGGVFSGDGVTGNSFDPAAAGTGHHEVVYTYSDSNGCASADTLVAAVYALPVVSAGMYADVCVDGSPVQLSGLPAGGTFTGAGVTGSSFDPAVAGTGSHDIVYAFSDSNGCSSADTTTVMVNAVPAVTLDPFTDLCTTSAPVTLSGGSPAGGLYSGTGVSNGIFDPSAAGAGTFVITYSYSDSAGCSASDTASVSVFLQPVVTFAPLSSTCITAPSFTLTGGSPAGGTYSGPGVANGQFDPAAAGLGVHTLIYTLAGTGGCNGIDSTTISVGSEPAVSLSVSPGIGCRDNTIYNGYGPQYLVVTATTSAGNFTYAWYRDGVLIPGSVSDTLQVTVAGSYSVVVTDAFGCSSSPSNPASISTIFVVDVRCGHDLKKVVLCHVPPGNPGNPQTLCIAPSAVPAHLSNHPGDCLGPCFNQRVSLNSLSDDLQLFVYPNPFTDRTTVEFSAYASGEATVELIDARGRQAALLFHGNIESDVLYEADVDGRDLPVGIYLVKITAGNLTTYQKLVKTR